MTQLIFSEEIPTTKDKTFENLPILTAMAHLILDFPISHEVWIANRHNLPFQVHVCSRKATSCFDKFLYSETNVCFWIRTKQLLGSVEILVLSNSTANFSFLFYFEKAKTQASLVNQHAFTSSPIHKALSRLHIPQGNPFPFFYMESNEYLLLIDCGTIQLNGIR